MPPKKRYFSYFPSGHLGPWDLHIAAQSVSGLRCAVSQSCVGAATVTTGGVTECKLSALELLHSLNRDCQQ